LGGSQTFADIGLRAQFSGDQDNFQSPDAVSDLGTAATVLDLIGSLHQGGKAVYKLGKTAHEAHGGKALDFHEQRTVFVHIANVAKSSGEVVKHSASLANAASVAGPAAYATGGFSALRHARKVAKAADRIRRLRHVKQDDERLFEGFEELEATEEPMLVRLSERENKNLSAKIDDDEKLFEGFEGLEATEEPMLVRLSERENKNSSAKIDLENLSEEQRRQVLDRELLAYALRKNVYGVTRKSMNTTAAVLGIAGAASGMTPAGWALLGASSAIGLTVGTWKLGGWLKNRYRAAWTLARGGGFREVEDKLDWRELDPNAEHFQMAKERRGFSRAMYAVGTTLNPTVSKKKIQHTLRTDVRQKRRRELGAVSTKLGGGALEIFEREFFSNYLAGRVSAEDGFPDEMVLALFQEQVRGGRRTAGSRKTGFKVMAKKLFISQAPEEYFELKEFLTLRKCLEGLENIEAQLEFWKCVGEKFEDDISQLESMYGSSDEEYERFLRWKALRKRGLNAELKEMLDTLYNDRDYAIRKHNELAEARDRWFAEWRQTMTDLEMPATRQTWNDEVEKWRALAGDRDTYECGLRDALAGRIMDKLKS
jgi:hypothetical protein